VHLHPLILTTPSVDASIKSLGAVIMQDGKQVGFGSKTLTTCKRRYANIDGELLAIVCGAQKFHTYVYGCRVIVEMDHKPLESIFWKPLNDAPPRLQRMPLKLTKYDLNVRFSPGKLRVISDCLSKAPISDTAPATEPEDVIGINLIEDLGFESSTLKRFKETSSNDETSRVVMEYILKGWPSKKNRLMNLLESIGPLRKS